MNAGERDIVGKKEGGKKGSARGSVQGRCDYTNLTTALDIEVDPLCRCLIRNADAFAATRPTLLFRPM